MYRSRGHIHRRFHLLDPPVGLIIRLGLQHRQAWEQYPNLPFKNTLNRTGTAAFSLHRRLIAFRREVDE